MTESGQPVLILKEGTTQTRGKEAQRNNITAAKAVAEILKSCLGPRGMDKMMVSGFGDATITNDGATIMKEMDIQHPAAKMMVEVAKTTDQEVGDGTTSVVTLTGELLAKAETLIDKNVHPTVIVDGYSKAAEKAIEICKKLALKINPTDKAMLKKIANTSIASKLVSEDREIFSDLAVNAVIQVAEKRGSEYYVDIDTIKVEKKAGASLIDSTLIKGVAIDKEVVHSGMPKRVENAKIILLNTPLEVEKPEFDAKLNIETPDQIKRYLDEENKMLQEMVNKILASGANVVMAQKGIDDMAQHFLAKKNVYAVRRIKESDMIKISKATGGRIVTNIDSLTSADLGRANLVEERKLGEDKWTFIEGCKDPKSITLLIRGGTERVVDEAERSIHDALCVVRNVVNNPAIVAGGGAPEAEIASQLRNWAQTLSGREQLAAKEFADALEVIPLTLAENAGLDPLDIQVALRAKHEGGGKWFGVSIFEGKVMDMAKLNVYEPLVVKEQIIKSASEAASMILRIDDVISATKPETGGPPAGGPPGGMEGEY
jgi:thermosome